MESGNLRCGRRLITSETGRGEVVKIEGRISFLGEVNPKEGKLYDGRSIKGKVLIAEGAKGSTVGAYVIYALKYYGNQPLAIIFEEETDPIVVSGCVMAGITHGDMFGKLDLRDGDVVDVWEEDGKLCLGISKTPP
ncbi:hypothetical protein IPA_09450 [Ignicoccus pacificus DSM 13166]|uniref:Phosphomevalonate dehydratase small subunit-like domain-containing protein n=1 Tax=Ignicoccus pacificus DSM 13166 TaxID=940294 RepID=A0A977KA71_9CREN|nr:hypothetical protein IPA_09450 [Ignicoccus pacificus DSM 13166]